MIDAASNLFVTDQRRPRAHVLGGRFSVDEKRLRIVNDPARVSSDAYARASGSASRRSRDAHAREH